MEKFLFFSNYRFIEVNIIDDQIAEEDETFFVRLSLDTQSGSSSGARRGIGSDTEEPSSRTGTNEDPLEHRRSLANADKTIVQIGKKSVCTVVIMNDDRKFV